MAHERLRNVQERVAMYTPKAVSSTLCPVAIKAAVAKVNLVLGVIHSRKVDSGEPVSARQLFGLWSGDNFLVGDAMEDWSSVCIKGVICGTFPTIKAVTSERCLDNLGYWLGGEWDGWITMDLVPYTSVAGQNAQVPPASYFKECEPAVKTFITDMNMGGLRHFVSLSQRPDGVIMSALASGSSGKKYQQEEENSELEDSGSEVDDQDEGAELYEGVIGEVVDPAVETDLIASGGTVLYKEGMSKVVRLSNDAIVGALHTHCSQVTYAGIPLANRLGLVASEVGVWTIFGKELGFTPKVSELQTAVHNVKYQHFDFGASHDFSKWYNTVFYDRMLVKHNFNQELALAAVRERIQQDCRKAGRAKGSPQDPYFIIRAILDGTWQQVGEPFQWSVRNSRVIPVLEHMPVHISTALNNPRGYCSLRPAIVGDTLEITIDKMRWRPHVVQSEEVGRPFGKETVWNPARIRVWSVVVDADMNIV